MSDTKSTSDTAEYQCLRIPQNQIANPRPPLPNSKATFYDLTNWGNVVNVVAKAKVFETAEFLKVLDLTNGSGDSVVPHNEAFPLREGKTYSLRVFQIVPAKPEASKWDAHDIELSAFSEQIGILKERQRVVGKYDVLTYVIKVAGLSSTERTAIELSAIPANQSQVLLSSIHLPVTIVAPSVLARIVRGLVIAASLALTFVPMIWTTPVSGHSWERVLPFLGILGFTISLVGWGRMLKAIGLSKGKG